MLLWERNTMFLGVREKNLSEFDEKKIVMMNNNTCYEWYVQEGKQCATRWKIYAFVGM